MTNEQLGKYWDSFNKWNKDEPIIESHTFEKMRDLMIGAMIDDRIDSPEVHQKIAYLIVYGTIEYLKKCAEHDPRFEDEGSNEELEHDRKERSKDLKDDIRDLTRNIYGEDL